MKKLLSFALVFGLFAAPGSLLASPWAEKDNYFSQTAGKFRFGLKNSTLGWTALFTEPYKPKYFTRQEKPWVGFWVGFARSCFYTVNGIIHLATFPIPVDFPDMGKGV
jgi:hypothetical protein